MAEFNPEIHEKIPGGFCLKPALVVIREISAETFRNRFDFEERVLIESSVSPRIKTFKNDLAAKTKPVKLDSPKIAAAIALLESENCLIPLEGETMAERKARLVADGTQEEVL